MYLDNSGFTTSKMKEMKNDGIWKKWASNLRINYGKHRVLWFKILVFSCHFFMLRKHFIIFHTVPKKFNGKINEISWPRTVLNTFPENPEKKRHEYMYLSLQKEKAHDFISLH